MTNDDNKRRLVDTFVNSVYLYDDRAVVSFNTREGASTLPLLNKFASDCAALGEPTKVYKKDIKPVKPIDTAFTGFYLTLFR